jgi:hypothetical protein
MGTDTPCIEHTGYCSPKGYGTLTRKGQFWLAHRWAWTQVHGEIPDGLFVLHKCDNPPCVNIEHLFLGTNDDNMKDMVAKGRSKDCGSPRKLTEAQVEEIRHAEGSQYEIAARYGVSPPYVYQLRAGKRRNDGY